VRYKDYVNVFSKTKAKTNTPHQLIDHSIDLTPNINLHYDRINNVSNVKFKTVKSNIETKLTNGFLQRSSSPEAALVMFVKKKDSRVRLCIS
jgi:hypothetical protein